MLFPQHLLRGVFPAESTGIWWENVGTSWSSQEVRINGTGTIGGSSCWRRWAPFQREDETPRCSLVEAALLGPQALWLRPGLSYVLALRSLIPKTSGITTGTRPSAPPSPAATPFCVPEPCVCAGMCVHVVCACVCRKHACTQHLPPVSACVRCRTGRGPSVSGRGCMAVSVLFRGPGLPGPARQPHRQWGQLSECSVSPPPAGQAEKQAVGG